MSGGGDRGRGGGRVAAVGARLGAWLETLGGARPAPLSPWWRALLLGAWWAALIFAVYATIGRATKFIYVDF